MAVRIQFRRGTAAEWAAANPTLGAGEAGYETDTAKFKLGTGNTVWNSLDYAGVNQTDIEDAVNAVIGGAPGALDTLNELAAALGEDENFANTIITLIGDHTADTVNVHGIANTANLVYQIELNDVSNNVSSVNNTLASHVSDTTDVHGISNTALLVYESQLSGHTDATTNVHGISNAALLVYQSALDAAVDTLDDNKAPKADPSFTGTVVLPSTTSIGDVSATEISFLNNVTSAIQTQIDAKADIEDAEFTGSVTLPANTSIGNVIAAEIGHLDGVTSGIQVQLDGKLATSVASTTYAPLAGATFTGAVVLTANTSIGTVDSTEISHLNGVTSSIQTQLNAKAGQSDVNNAIALKANVLNPAFEISGFVETLVHNGVFSVQDMGFNGIFIATLQNYSGSLPQNNDVYYIDDIIMAGIPLVDAGTSTSGGNAGITFMLQDPNNPAHVAALNDYESLYTFDTTGVFKLLSLSSATISATEIRHLDGVTSAVQAQLNSKLNLSGGTLTGALTLSGAPTSDLHAATKQYVDGLAAGINFHQPVVAATSGNLAGTYNNGTSGVGATLTKSSDGDIGTIDGATVSVGNRILLRAQTDKKQNGVYTITAVGGPVAPWQITRATDADNNPAGELANGDFVFTTQGTTNGSKGFIVSTVGTITIGTSDIEYAQFNASEAVIAGTNILKVGETISVVSNPTFANVITASSGVAFSDGTQTKQGVPSITTITPLTASYTLSNLNERDTIIEISNTSATTVTIPLDSTINYPVGTTLDILQTNTGQVTIGNAVGVTLNATPGLKLRTRWSSATLLKRGADSWVAFGDLTA